LNVVTRGKAGNNFRHFNANLVGYFVLVGTGRATGAGKSDAFIQLAVEQGGVAASL
jgi:hypothetical protein